MEVTSLECQNRQLPGPRSPACWAFAGLHGACCGLVLAVSTLLLEDLEERSRCPELGGTRVLGGNIWGVGVTEAIMLGDGC